MVRVVSTYAFYCSYFNIVGEREPRSCSGEGQESILRVFGRAHATPRPRDTVRPRSYKSGGHGMSSRSPSSATTPIIGETSYFFQSISHILFSSHLKTQIRFGFPISEIKYSVLNRSRRQQVLLCLK